MAEHEAERVQECAVCGRTILRGERVTPYVAPDGATQGVCALCRERAEAAGWVRADLAAAGHATAPRRRRGLKLRERVRDYAERARPSPPEPAADAPARPSRATATAAPEQAPKAVPTVTPEPEPVAKPKPRPKPETPEQRIRRTIERFNESDQAHVVAGLIRSLGEPTAAVEDVSAKPPRARVTIAWELSWYRWEVAADGDQPVREVGKGGELSELDGGEPEWNATIDGEGRVQWPESS